MSDDDDLLISVSLPLDVDGFLPRSCPSCERTFGWLDSGDDEDEGDEHHADGYFCPYCRQQAASDQWFTPEQIATIQQAAYDEVVEPFTKRLQDSVDKINRSGSGLISASLEAKRDAERSVKPKEVAEMRRAVFACHPNEPLKVLSEAPQAHCLICGAPETTAPKASG